MGTSAPAIITHDIPITEPWHEPLALPAPNPDHFAPEFAPIPDRTAVPVPIRRQDGSNTSNTRRVG